MMNDEEQKFYTELGKILKEGRLHSRLSLRYVSESIGSKTKSSLMRYEDGESRASMDTIRRLCESSKSLWVMRTKICPCNTPEALKMIRNRR